MQSRGLPCQTRIVSDNPLTRQGNAALSTNTPERHLLGLNQSGTAQQARNLP